MSQERCCTSTGRSQREVVARAWIPGRMMNLANISVSTPRLPRNLWAVLLAGGDGVRLRDLTVRIVGDHRPKQFCPIVGAESLLRQTRASS